jgi:arabinose-5-phosphate isomerase
MACVIRNRVEIVLAINEASELLTNHDRLLGPLLDLSNGLVAITSDAHSTIARAADAAIIYGPVEESGPLALAPSTSTTIMIALGDALASVLAGARRFSTEDFARFHPAGSLGLKLALVESLMRTGHDLRVASANLTVREAFVHGRHTGRRTGAVILVDAHQRLTGLFTDSDLAKLFERKHDSAIDRPVSEVMTRDPITVSVGSRVGAALDVMRACKISELPVVDGNHHPVGLLDVTDLIGLPARADASSAARSARRRASA